MQFEITFTRLGVIVALVFLAGFAGYKIADHEKEVFTPIEGNVWEYGE